jgi:hypothetical protein
VLLTVKADCTYSYHPALKGKKYNYVVLLGPASYYEIRKLTTTSMEGSYFNSGAEWGYF